MTDNRRWGALVFGLLIVSMLGHESALGNPTVGFVENFTSTIGGFAGGSSLSNPGTGGVDGASDGFLRVFNSLPVNFGTRSNTADYAGNYRLAGVTHIRFFLNDVEANQAFQIHFGIGIGGQQNFWEYNVPFIPLDNAWSEFQVDLNDSTQFTRTQGTGSFAGALQNATNILFRHDLPPFSAPDPIAGELGIDKIRFLGSAPVLPATWGLIKSLYR